VSTFWVVRPADLNNDGYIDVVNGRNTGLQDGLGLVMATGPESWADETLIPTTGGSVLSLELADFDLDGNQDIVFHNWDPPNNQVHVRAGNGDGTFSTDVADRRPVGRSSQDRGR
jgi:hypothetical protein